MGKLSLFAHMRGGAQFNSTFWEEYIQSFAQDSSYTPRKIVYLQCNFYGENSFGTYTKKNDQTAAKALMEQLCRQFSTFQWTDADFQEYPRRGHFLKADTLLLLRYGKQWRILSVDESVFSVTSLAEATDLTDIGYLRAMLARELWYTRSKSVFARLSIDTDAETLSIEEIQEGLFIDKGERLSGVLSSLCQAVQTSLTTLEPAPQAIVATVAIQSLKRTKDGATTLKHLDKIFSDAYSSEHGVLPEQMATLGKRIQHMFIMIDEVTGDESGAEFLDGIQSFLKKYDLFNPVYGINTKVIVADASIVDPRIIRQHLATTGYEPHKIYLRKWITFPHI